MKEKKKKVFIFQNVLEAGYRNNVRLYLFKMCFVCY